MKATVLTYSTSNKVKVWIYDDYKEFIKIWESDNERINETKLIGCAVVFKDELIIDGDLMFKPSEEIKNITDFPAFVEQLKKAGIENEILYEDFSCSNKYAKAWEMTKAEFADDVYFTADVFGGWGGVDHYVKIFGDYKGNEFVLGVKPTPTKAKKYAKQFHKAIVKNAIENGRKIPAKVLDEYPDLKMKEIKNHLNTNTKKRKKLNNIILGRKTKIILPNGERRNGQFALVDLNDILASHNEKSFSDTKGYPVNKFGININDRNYKGDVNAQARVTEMARNLAPELLVSTDHSENGSPIIDERGIVVSGNNRTMSVKLAASDYPDKYFDYKEWLCDELPSFGFKSEKLEANESGVMCNESTFTRIKKGWLFDIKGKTSLFEKPFLVRIDYDFPAYETGELAKYNQSGKKAERPIDKSIQVSNRLNESLFCNTNIPKLFADHESMSEFYNSFSDQKELLGLLINCNLITEQEKPKYFDQKFGFTPDGKSYIETILAGVVLKPDVLALTNIQGVRMLRQRIVTSLPVLMNNKALKSGSLIDEVNKAVKYQADLKQSSLKFPDFINQIKAFDQNDYSFKTVYLNRLINKGGILFKKSIDRYNKSLEQSGTTGLFAAEVVTPEEAFKKIIIPQVDEKDAKLIERFFNSSNKGDEVEQLIKSLNERSKKLIQNFQ